MNHRDEIEELDYKLRISEEKQEDLKINICKNKYM